MRAHCNFPPVHFQCGVVSKCTRDCDWDCRIVSGENLTHTVMDKVELQPQSAHQSGLGGKSCCCQACSLHVL